jgi:hypothetical protein
MMLPLPSSIMIRAVQQEQFPHNIAASCFAHNLDALESRIVILSINSPP